MELFEKRLVHKRKRERRTVQVMFFSQKFPSRRLRHPQEVGETIPILHAMTAERVSLQRRQPLRLSLRTHTVFCETHQITL
jgi:hypothetical protein